MYCPRCGNQNEDGSAFCSNCGLDLRGKPAAGPAAVQMSDAMPPVWGQAGAAAPPKPRKSRKKAWIIAASALVVIAAAAVGAYFIFSGGGVKLEGKYYNISQSNWYLDFTSDEKDPCRGTYTDGGLGPQVVKGSFVIDHGSATLTAEGATQKDTVIVSDGYLIYEEGIMKGEVPAGKTFDGTFTRTNEALDMTYSFKKDGTYHSAVRYNEGGGHEESGTYERVGDKIEMKRELGGVALKETFLVYHNHIAINVYQK